MRVSVRNQLSLVEPAIKHEHARELQQIRCFLDEHPEMAELVHGDLVRGLKNPATGRRGRMSADQVLMALLIKQMNGFSYVGLAYHLADSRTYRAVCGFGIGDMAPSAKTLQRDIKRLQAPTLEAINRLLVASAAGKGIEKGRKVRVDCTVVDANIHHPTDSSLLWDCVRVLCRATQRAKEIVAVAATDHRRRAKRRALGICNARTDKQRRALYRDLLQVTRKTVDAAKRVRAALATGPVSDLFKAIVAGCHNPHKSGDVVRGGIIAGRRVGSGEWRRGRVRRGRRSRRVVVVC